MTVLDSSAAIDFLLADGAAAAVQDLLEAEGPLAAPDLLVFEVLAVLRRQVLRGSISSERAGRAIDDMGALAVDLFPTLPLSTRAWQLRENFTAADALFVALAELLGEPLATKDGALAAAMRRHTGVEALELSG